MSLLIRDYRSGDAGAAALLFYETVRATALRDYSDVQIVAWAPEIPDPAQWHQRMSARHSFIADKSGYMLGFAELEADGHLDMLYVARDFVGTGIGSALLDHTERHARSLGLARIFTEASKTARPLFERKGFVLVAEQEVMRNGTPLMNYRMEKRL